MPWMPTLTPLGTRVLVAPRNSANERPSARSSASSTAISSAAFAIGWPLTGARMPATSSAATGPSPCRRGTSWVLIVIAAPSTYSAE